MAIESNLKQRLSGLDGDRFCLEVNGVYGTTWIRELQQALKWEEMGLKIRIISV